LISQTSWLLFAAIFALLAYEVVESSIIAKHGDNSLSLFGFILPLTPFLSASAIAVAIRSNMVLVKSHQSQGHYITSLMLWAGLTAILMGGVFYISKGFVLSLLGFDTWLMQWSQAQQVFYKAEIFSYLNYKIYSLVALFLIWQISTILRTLGYHKRSASLLLSWMLLKLFMLTQIIDVQSTALITELGQLHFTTDMTFALFGLMLLSNKIQFCFKTLKLDIIFNDKKTSIILMLQQLVPPLSLAFLMAIVVRVDASHIGVFAIVFRLEPLLLLLPMVLTASLPASIGLNFWAGNKKCCYQVLKLSFALIIIFQLILATFLNIYLAELIKVLCPDCEQVKMIKSYLALLPFSYAALGLAVLYPSCLNAIGRPKQALFKLVFHRLVLIPLFVLVGYLSGLQNNIYYALFFAHMAAGLFVLLHFRRSLKPKKQNDEKLYTPLKNNLIKHVSVD
jgi:Na+-driven multidrug efflux pump